MTYETEKELSARTKIPERTLRQWRWLDTGPPYIKAGRRVLYVPEQVDRWLASQGQAAAREATG